MTDPTDHLADALHRLRGEIRDRVPVPAAAGLRARAIRRLRVRRATTAVLAAGAVAALAIGGNAVLRPTAAPPVPPVESPTPHETNPAEPTPPEPAPPSATPSPRPEPRPVGPIDDPIAQVDWRDATLTVPARDGCPDGPVALTAASDLAATAIGPAGSFPAILLDATKVAYGDLTGDGRAEAVLEASCAESEEGLASGHGGQLLVVARSGDGTLTGLGWTGPPGVAYLSYWVSDQRLLIDGDPWTAGPEDWFVPVPGLALAYRWDGSGFDGWQPAAAYPPMLPLDHEQDGPPVRPRAVGAGLGCPDGELRFTRAGEAEWGGGASTGGATYTIPSGAGAFQQYLFDLDHTGDRLLVTTLSCERPDGSAGHGLAVFERAGDGWQGISVLPPPEAGGGGPASWSFEDDRLLVDWPTRDDATAYRWTGTVFEPESE